MVANLDPLRTVLMLDRGDSVLPLPIAMTVIGRIEKRPGRRGNCRLTLYVEGQPVYVASGEHVGEAFTPVRGWINLALRAERGLA